MRKVKKVIFGLSVIFILITITTNFYITFDNFKYYKNASNLKQNEKHNDEGKVKITELLTTMNDAINYIKKNLEDQYYNDIEITLINDCINAVDSIKNSLKFLNDSEFENLEVKSNELEKSLNMLKINLKESDFNNSLEIINDKVIKDYNEWKNYITDILHE